MFECACEILLLGVHFDETVGDGGRKGMEIMLCGRVVELMTRAISLDEGLICEVTADLSGVQVGEGGDS